MESTENTPRGQSEHQTKRTPSGPLSFRDTMQHMVNRQSGSIIEKTSNEQSESIAKNINADETASPQANTVTDESSSQQADIAADEISSQQSDAIADEDFSQQTNTSVDEDSSQQTNTSVDEGSSQQTDAVAASNSKLPTKKIALYIATGAAAILLLTYLGISFFFQKHFLFHTLINEQDFSCKTLDEARAFFDDKANDYTLEIVESDGEIEQIIGKEISMKWDDNLKLNYILDKQNPFAWPLEFFKEKSEDVIFFISCDEDALSKKIDLLNAIVKEPVSPQSAYPKFDGDAFVIEPEVYGTALDSEKLKERILESVLNLEKSLDLQEEGFYEKPQYTTDSKEMKQVCKRLNDYCKASITYEMDTPVVVDKTLISTWLSVDEKFNVILDETAVQNWILEFDARYDTLGTTRALTTPTGRETEVSGGTYGWSINEDEEYAVLLSSIKNGEVLTRTPSYGQTAASHAPQDWGNTFLEVDLSAQHMWYLRDGAVVFESDVVTGCTPIGLGTPAGVYTILEKLSPTILVGNIVPETGEPEYRTPVDYWMRVTYSGIGFHDATWQPAFGGDLYLWNGSHGCINMPYYNAQELYSIIEVGLPVVIHY